MLVFIKVSKQGRKIITEPSINVLKRKGQMLFIEDQ